MKILSAPSVIICMIEMGGKGKDKKKDDDKYKNATERE